MSWLSAAWNWYAYAPSSGKDTINPIVAGLGGAALVWAAIRQARTATRRHYEQTRADLQRRLTESFSKAVEQLSDRDKIEARLGGIYTLERLAIEAIAQVRSPPWRRRLLLRLLHRKQPPPADPVSDLFWTVMETLTAFVRERTRPEAERLAKPREQRIAESAHLLWKNAGMPEGRSGEFWSAALEQEARREERPAIDPAIDIAAVLEVLRRRPAAGREREKLRDWRLDLRMTDLRGAFLSGAHLQGADLIAAHLEGNPAAQSGYRDNAAQQVQIFRAQNGFTD